MDAYLIDVLTLPSGAGHILLKDKGRYRGGTRREKPRRDPFGVTKKLRCRSFGTEGGTDECHAPERPDASRRGCYARRNRWRGTHAAVGGRSGILPGPLYLAVVLG